MTVDPAWEAAHAARAWGKYPHPAVVDFIGRHYGMLDAGTTRGSRPMALDIGAGAGAVTVLLAREGFMVSAVESSPSAVRRIHQRLNYENLRRCADVACFDIASVPAEKTEEFDVALDVCCLSCIPGGEARAVIESVHGWIKPGGRFLSVMAADDCDPAVHGEFQVRQATRADIDMLFGAFSDVFVGKHTRLTRRGFISEWVVEAQK